MRGVHVFFPAVDDGVDLFTSKGLGIQMKASSLSHGRYHFNLRHWTYGDDKRRQIPRRIHSSVTHVVLWGLDEDVFWIVPRELANKVHISLSKANIPRRYNSTSKVWPCLGAWQSITGKFR
jgi:hypothetical protein